MDLKLDTVQDAIELQGLCIELASRLEEMNECMPALTATSKDALTKAVKVMDFLSDEIIPNLCINN